MRRARLKAVVISVAFSALLGGCSFLLDFDDLQTGSQTADNDDDASVPDGTDDIDGGLGVGGNAPGGGAGGRSGMTDGGAAGLPIIGLGGGTSIGGTGSGGALMCPEESDPCLQMAPVNGVCVLPVLVPDGTQLNVTPNATSVRATTLVAGNGRFYLAVHGEFMTPFPSGGNAQIFVVHPTDPLAAEEGATLRNVLDVGEIQSRIALVPDGSNSVHAFFATQRLPGLELELAQVDLDQNLATPSAVTFRGPYSAAAAASNIGPAAGLTASGERFAAWPSTEGVAFYGSETAPDGNPQLSADAPRSLAALTGTGSPAVGWTVGTTDPPLLRVATVVSTTDAQIPDTPLCPAFSGLDPFSLKSSPSPNGVMWGLTVSARGASFQSVGLLATCLDGNMATPPPACVPEMPDCAKVAADTSDLTAYPATQPATDRTFSVVAAAFTEESAVAEALGLTVPVSILSLLDASGVAAGPGVGLGLGTLRNHGIAVLDRQVAVSWVDANVPGADVVRLQRSSICYPPEMP